MSGEGGGTSAKKIIQPGLSAVWAGPWWLYQSRYGIFQEFALSGFVAFVAEEILEFKVINCHALKINRRRCLKKTIIF